MSGSQDIMPANNISNEVKKVLEKEGLKPSVVGISKQIISPTGFFDTINVLDDEMLNKLDKKENYNIVKVY